MNSDKFIQKIALQTLQIECETLNNLQAVINSNFAEVVQSIFHCSGRLIVTGVGKSAIVAQKIVATLNSTGTPSVYMHAADAVHGDLGMIHPDDFVLCLSKSGETAEVKVLLPFLKATGNKVIGMTARLNSYLGQHADFVLHTPVPQEADPNNLAPTASTIAQAALGDALATALLALRGFTAKDFAKFHPGGTLGKQLYLRVDNLYTQNEKPQVLPTATLQEVIVEMTSKRLGCTAVTNSKNQLIGIITDGDLRRMLESGKSLSDLSAEDIMTSGPQKIVGPALAVKALEIMRERSITQLPVTEGDTYLGMVHLHDLIKEGLV